MKRGTHYLPRRQAVVYAATERMLRETGTNRRSFAMEVAERYLQITPEDDRTHAFRLTAGGKVEDDKKHNGQILGRYLDGTVKVLPADLEDAWVLALPEPYRSDCERDLARRRGLLPVRALDGQGGAEVASLAKLAADFGELMTALAPALADGKIDAADLPFVRRGLNEADDLIASVLAIRRPLQALIPEAGA